MREELGEEWLQGPFFELPTVPARVLPRNVVFQQRSRVLEDGSLEHYEKPRVTTDASDGNLESVGGDCDGICATCTGTANRNGDNRCPSPQHDEVIASQVNQVCDSSAWTVYGRDRSISATDLRHIRVAYSMDGTVPCTIDLSRTRFCSLPFTPNSQENSTRSYLRLSRSLYHFR